MHAGAALGSVEPSRKEKLSYTGCLALMIFQAAEERAKRGA
jgi:hypothetical protein